MFLSLSDSQSRKRVLNLFNTSLAYFSSVLDFLARQNVPSDQALRAIKFSEFSCYKKSQRVALSHYSALLDYGKHQLEDPLFGFHVGSDVQSADYGVLGYLIESSANLGEAIKHLLVFDKLVANIGVIEFSTTDEVATIRWTPQQNCSEQVILRNMAAWFTTAKQILGDQLAPTKVLFTYPYKVEQQQQLNKYLHCSVFVNSHFNQIEFPVEMLVVAFRSNNPPLHQSMTELSNQELASLNTTSSLRAEIAHLLNIKPDLQDCTLIQFAHLFNRSTRTLQRQLKNENCRFGELLDDERKTRTLNQLNKIKLIELSQQLDLIEQSSFNRAFKRWFGCSPSRYIREQAK